MTPTPLPPSASFAILVIIDEALQAVRDILGLEHRVEKEGLDYFYGWVSSHFVVCTQCKDQSTNPANSRTEAMLRVWQPQNLLVVDIAGGVPDAKRTTNSNVTGRDGVAKGDVVGHKIIRCYEYEKVVKGEFEPRDYPIRESSPYLREKLHSIRSSESPKWPSYVTIAKPHGVKAAPKVIEAEILSGDKLLDDCSHSLVERLFELNPKVVAVEMESAGAGRAAYDAQARRLYTDFLVIRGITDFCSKAERNLWKPYAARAAAAFTRELIENSRPPLEVTDDYADYKQDLEEDLTKSYPESRTDRRFEMTFRLGNESAVQLLDLLSTALHEKRVILKAPAGAGKSEVVGRLSREFVGRQHAAAVIDLKLWTPELSGELSRLGLDSDGVQARMEVLFRRALGDINVQRLMRFAESRKVMILVDGLNEVSSPEDAHQILETLSEFIRSNAPRVAAVITDRRTNRGAAEKQWATVELRALSGYEVRKHIDAAFGEGVYEQLPETNRSLLELPFFLNIALDSLSVDLESRMAALYGFFLKHVGLDDDELNPVAAAAFEMYRRFRSPSFPEQEFRDRVAAPSIWQKVEGVIRKQPENRAQFVHQLMHDYLVSRHLANNPEEWNPLGFDTATFESNSTDPLPMALDQITSLEAGDAFVKSVYDWNWYAAIRCISETSEDHRRNVSHQLEIALFAVVAEKLFDPVKGTRERARSVLEKFARPPASTFQEAQNRPQLLAMLAEIHAGKLEGDETWFVTWKALFSRLESPPLTEAEILTLASDDSVLGWTAANVIRRFDLPAADMRQLRGIYEARADDNPLSRSIQWRVVHALGMFSVLENVQLLMRALRHHSYRWINYGAARSLIEVAARSTEVSLRNQTIEELRASLDSLSRPVLEEIAKAVFYRELPRDWADLVVPLLEKARDLQQTEGDKEWWQDRVDDFVRFWARNKPS